MKKITKGNDFRMYIPVCRIVEGAQIEFPLPACTDIEVNLSNTFAKIGISYSIDREHDNVIIAYVNGTLLRVGNYALEVKGKIFGNNWRSNEYEQIQIVDNNASADVDFSQDDGENSVIMDTAIAILAPDPGFYEKVEDAESARVMAEGVRVESERIRVLFESERNDNESVRRESEEARTTAETERAINENNRVESENIRLSNEEGRIAHEKARENNEAIRVANESERCTRETERERNESGRELSEDKRITNEQKRIADNAIVLQEEGVRISNETSRKDNEAIRISHESDRILAENKRIADEKTRQDNENGRVSAESLRADIFNDLEADMRQAISEAELAIVNADTATERAKSASQSAENASDAANLAADRASISAGMADDASTKTNIAIANAELATQSALTAAEKAEDAAEYIYGGMEEIVTVACSTSMEGLSMQGLIINVYVNKSEVPDKYTTDENGIAFFKIKKGLTYEVEAPDIEGCAPIKTISHTAQFSVRNIEVIYKPYDLYDYEKITLAFRKWYNINGAYTPIAYTEGVAYVKYDDSQVECRPNSDGIAYVTIPLGKSYTIEVEKPDELVISGGIYIKTYIAEKTTRFIPINFREYIDGVLIVDINGNEYTHEAWMDSNREPSDAVLIHFATPELIANSGDFFMSIDEIATQKYHDDDAKITAVAWCNSATLFLDIPSNGSLSTSKYYYDGLTATNFIANEGVNRGMTTMSASKALSKSFHLLSQPDMQGFLPSYGQWISVVDNAEIINNIIADLRPNSSYRSFWAINKGTSAQNGASLAWYVGSSIVGNLTKSSNYFAAFPGYANSSL